VVEPEEEPELSCPNTITCIKMSITVVITDRQNFLIVSM